MRIRDHRIGSPVAWAATLVFVALMVVWSVLTPQFRNPDEPAHVNSVVRLLEGGGWPAPGDARMLPQVLRAKTLSGFSAVDGQQGNWAGGTLLPGVRRTVPTADLMYYALFSNRTPTPPGQRLPFDQLTLTRTINPHSYDDQMTQHPPLYYGLTAGVLKVVGAENWRYDRALELMRLVSVLLVAPLPLLVYSTTVRLTGRRRLGDLASVLPLAVPQLGAIGAAVSNDALVIALGGVLILLMARLATGAVGWRTTVGTGVALGLALLTKGTLLAAVPCVGLALIVGARRGRVLSWAATISRLAVLWVLAFAIGGWWWGLNLVRYGTLQPAGFSGAAQAHLVTGRPRLSIFGFAEPFVTHVTTTFWGEFGQLELPLPAPLVAALTVVLLVAVLLAFRRGGPGWSLAIPLLVMIVTVVLLYQTTYSAHRQSGQFPGLQGRYLYGGIVALLAAAAIGVGRLTRPGGAWERWLTPVALGSSLLVAAYGLWVAFFGYYIELDWTLRDGAARLLDWAPFPRWLTLAIFAALVLTALFALVVAVLQALHRDRSGPPPDAAGGASEVTTADRPSSLPAAAVPDHAQVRPA
jgi:4-amino-4-deoxy-L-arabinose transferase-like glycosyltransferase